MPGYRRKTYSRKRTYRRRRPRASIGSMALSAIKGYALSKLKQKLGLNTEKHWVDTLETAVTLTTSAADMAYAFLIPQDDTVNGRNGQTVRLVSYNCVINLNSGTAGNQTRIIFVRWRNTRGATPSGTNLLDAPARITSPFNMGDTVSSTGFTVLFDKTYALAATGQDGDRKIIRFSYRPRAHHLTWTSSNTTGVASALTDGYVIGYIYTDNIATSAGYSANHRIKFVDN